MTKREMAADLASRRYPAQPTARTREFNRLMSLSKAWLERTYAVRTAN